MNDPTFFHFQDRVLSVLWRWGIASALTGSLAALARSPLVRHAGIQALAWGAIDAALAYFGRRGARAKIATVASDGPAQARRFRLILLANAGLDIGYVAGGLALVRGARGRAERTGMGIGIVIQGLFLLGYDSILAYLAGRWTEKN